MNSTMVIATGNVVTDPVLRTTENGHAVTTVRVASNERRHNPTTNEWENINTSFYNVSCWRMLGERVAACIRKGDPVFFVGRQQVREFQRNNGSSDHCVDVYADVFGPDLRRVTVTVNRKPRAVPNLQTPEQTPEQPAPQITELSEPAA